MMPRLSISPHGPEFSRLVFGTWRMLGGQPTPQEINRRLQTGVELGITTIDTAEIYGVYEVERALGEYSLALSAGLRDKVEIVTKAGIYAPCKYHPDRHTAHYDASGPRMVKSLEKSLRFLGTDHVELLLIHRPDWLTRADDTAGGLNRLLREGKIRAAGASNYSTAQSRSARRPHGKSRLATNQVEFNLLHMDPIYDGTLAQCEKLGILPMAWSPLAGGRLFDPSHEAGQRLIKVAEEMAPPLRRGERRPVGPGLGHGPSQPAAADHRQQPHRALAGRGRRGRYRIAEGGLVRPLAGRARAARAVGDLTERC